MDRQGVQSVVSGDGAGAAGKHLRHLIAIYLGFICGSQWLLWDVTSEIYEESCPIFATIFMQLFATIMKQHPRFFPADCVSQQSPMCDLAGKLFLSLSSHLFPASCRNHWKFTSSPFVPLPHI